MSGKLVEASVRILYGLLSPTFKRQKGSGKAGLRTQRVPFVVSGHLSFVCGLSVLGLVVLPVLGEGRDTTGSKNSNGTTTVGRRKRLLGQAAKATKDSSAQIHMYVRMYVLAL